MIIIVWALIAVLSVPLTGGRLRRLATLPIRGAWLAWGSVLVQTALVSAPSSTPRLLGHVVHIASYLMAGAFGIANRRLPGVALICLGGALNFAAIVANGGIMPASATAVRISGLAARKRFDNSGLVPHARLAWLGDIFAIPAKWPLANVFSVGDLLVVLGIGILAHRWCRSAANEGGMETSSEPATA
jgi:Family of unknown function (DUF5317)